MTMAMLAVRGVGKYSGWAGRGRAELTQEPVQLLLIYYFMNCF